MPRVDLFYPCLEGASRSGRRLEGKLGVAVNTDCVIAIATVNQLGGLGLEFMSQKTDRGNLDQGPMALSWIGLTQDPGSGWQRFAAEVVAEREAANVPCMVKDFLTRGPLFF
jgi:hypothetical protein